MIAVAIDGPAGAGKSTLARAAAKELGFLYIDTGALYRAIAYCMLRGGVDPSDAAAVEAALPGVQVELKFVQGEQRVFLGGEDVSGAIRTGAVSMAASRVSAIPAVRARLLSMQRDFARNYNVVMDGRDIGTVVLPQAQVKVFLTASAEERARRRFLELQQKGQPAGYEQVLAEIRQRDEQDSHRAISPLAPAADSVLLDTTGVSPEEAVARLVSLVRAAGCA